MRVKFVVLFILITSVIAQETHNLEIIWVKAGDTTFLSYGFLSNCPGDVNGDGYDDILYYGNERSWAGRAFLFYGCSNLDTIPDAIFSNSNGYNAVCMGDFNGDHFDDIALGNQNGPDGYGRVYIYLGGNPIDTICDFQMRGPHGGSLFGQALCSGDVNGDSYDDLIVGAYGYDNLKGRVYIYFGGPNFDTIPDVILDGGHQGQYEGFGTTVGSSADVNSDNYDDLIVGAPDFGGGRGRIYIYYGGNPMNTIYDVAMSGEVSGENLGWTPTVNLLKTEFEYDMAVFGSAFWPYGYPGRSPGKNYVLFGGVPMDSIPDVWMIGWTDSSGLGLSVSSAGIVNQTNSEAIISGAPREYNDKGAAYLWLSGSLLDTIPDAWIRGTVSGEGIGWYVASVGDVDGDNIDEFMVSNYASTQTSKRVWVCKYTGPGVEERQTLDATRLTLEVNPNPAKGVLRVRGPLSERNIKIFDISGKMIKEIEILRYAQNDGAGGTKISLKGINPGTYFLQLGKEIKKFLIVR